MQRRNYIQAIVVAGGTVALLANAAVVAAQPWLTNAPIITVQNEVYRAHTQVGRGELTQQFNAGPGLERWENISQETQDDARTNNRARVSLDNGQTWSAYQTLPDDVVTHAGVSFWEGPDHAMPVYDPRAGVLVQGWLRQVLGSNNTFYNFTYYRLSTDHGLTRSRTERAKQHPVHEFFPVGESANASARIVSIELRRRWRRLGLGWRQL